MSVFGKYTAGLTFVGDILVGVVIGVAALRLAGITLISRQEIDRQSRLIADLNQ